MIEVEKTYKVTLTEEQLRYLYLILDSKDVSGTVINPFYHKLKEIYDSVYSDYKNSK